MQDGRGLLQTSPNESRQRTPPNVVEQQKGKRRGIIQDERGQDQPASKEDVRLGAPKPRERYHRISQAIWWVCFAFRAG
jgi:hypothetical protein